MILEKQKESEVLTMGEESSESIAMTLDLDSAQFLMQMMSKNIYSDAIGSLIRECVSNSLDSNRCAQTDKPIIVTFKASADNNYEFSTEDFGCGLNHEEVFEILSKYGKSTKREDKDALGVFGIGFKSPLAYSSSFYFITRKDGVERKYMMYEGEEVNTIDLLYESPTEEINGVKVIVPVKYSDRQEFITKIKEQLAYFENVYFDVPSISNSYRYGSDIEGVNNDFVIHRGEDFQYSELITTSELHICLDNVYYPIDFEKLGISVISVPVGLRFGLSDGIFPTINREAIRLTQEAKTIILAKIKTVADYFVAKYNEQITDTDDINEIFKHYDSSYKNVMIANQSFDINDLIKYSDLIITIPKLNGVELLDLEDLTRARNIILGEHECKFKERRGRLTETKQIEYLRIDEIDKYYVYSERMSGNKKEYIKTFLPDYSLLLMKVRKFRLGLYDNTWRYNSVQTYCRILKLIDHPRNEWRQRIKEFQYIQSMFIDKLKDIDKIEIPQSWLDARKKQRVSNGNGRRIKLSGEVFGKRATNLERFVQGQNCKFVADTFKLENIHKTPGLMVYDSYENQSKLDAIYHISNSKIRCLSFSNRELGVLEKVEIHNLMTYKKFMEGNNKPFKRLITAYLINRLIENKKHVFNNSRHLKTISKDLYEKLELLGEYKRKHLRYADDVIYTTMLEVAEKHQLFDMEIYHTYLEIKELLTKLVFLNPVLKTMPGSYGNEDMVPVLVDLFKYYRHRIDYTNYHCPLNTPLEENVLTEELVEELEN